eukprot:2930866-Amphidinium_carterae.1
MACSQDSTSMPHEASAFHVDAGVGRAVVDFDTVAAGTLVEHTTTTRLAISADRMWSTNTSVAWASEAWLQDFNDSVHWQNLTWPNESTSKAPATPTSCSKLYDEVTFVEGFPLLIRTRHWHDLRKVIHVVHSGGDHGGSGPSDPRCRVCLHVSYACTPTRRLYCQLQRQAHASGSSPASVDLPIVALNVGLLVLTLLALTAYASPGTLRAWGGTLDTVRFYLCCFRTGYVLVVVVVAQYSATAALTSNSLDAAEAASL